MAEVDKEGDIAPLCLDLCCGRGGVTKGFLAAGWQVIGIDIERHPDYPMEADFRLADVRDVDGQEFKDIAFVWASPPCREFSLWQMPWTRARASEPDMSIVNACWRIIQETGCRSYILENVRSAQKWLGQALLRRGAHFFWGSVPLLPYSQRRPKEQYSSKRADLRAEISYDLSYGLAMALRK